MTTKVLWVSRHEMTSEQLADLRRIYGNVSVTKLDKTIQSAEDILEVGDAFDVYVLQS